MLLGYRCANSRMTVAVAADHNLRTTDPHEIVLRDDPDLAKMVFRVDAREGKTVRIEKIVAYHSSRGLPVRELSDRCNRTLDRAARYDVDYYLAEQRGWYDRFWDAADVQVGSDDPTQAAVQQADPLQPLQLAQASGRSDGHGVAAKGVSGSGLRRPLLLGHRGLRRTRSSPTPNPTWPGTSCTSGAGCCPAARERARELCAARGALPLADDQRRGGLGVLRRRHRPGAHRRRRRPRPRPVRQRHR